MSASIYLGLLAPSSGGLGSTEVVRLFAALTVLLLAARGLGEVARRLNQPAVLGELVSGILLGPALLGRLAPGAAAWLFPAEGPTAQILDGVRALAIVLFLLVAGLEVDLSSVFKQGRAALAVGAAGILAPFALGALAAGLAPDLLGAPEGPGRASFVLFFATALSISALPVIVRTLMDLYLYRTELGMVVVAAAVLNDLVGWMVFAAVLGLAGAESPPVLQVAALTILFTALALSLGRWTLHRVLPWVQAHAEWPGGMLAFAIATAFVGAALTEWIGIGAIFGAFLAGVALGDSSHLRQRTRTTIGEFVSSFFAPLFFGMIGLRTDFVASFDLVLTLTVVGLACLGKIVGCGLGARAAGMPPRESWAIGFAMNARGMMEIILGLAAMQQGIIGERMFVSLVVMALFTSALAGPAIGKLLGRKKPARFSAYLSPRAFVQRLAARDRRGAVRELSAALARAHGLDAAAVEAAAWAREEIGATGIGRGIAIPHARLEGLPAPVVALGLSPGGVDFNAPDGEGARLVFLILTPPGDAQAQLEILSDVGRTLSDARAREGILAAGSFTEVLAIVRTEPA